MGPSSCAGVIAFLILKDGVTVEQEEIVQSLKDLVRKKIAAFAIPTAFVVGFYYRRKCVIIKFGYESVLFRNTIQQITLYSL